MDSMFYEATNFYQDLSSWCVTNIGTEPTTFAYNSMTGAPAEYYPIWGTCPPEPEPEPEPEPPALFIRSFNQENELLAEINLYGGITSAGRIIS